MVKTIENRIWPIPPCVVLIYSIHYAKTSSTFEFLAEAFWCHAHHFHRKASAKNSSKLNKFLHSEVNILIHHIIVQDQNNITIPPVITLLPVDGRWGKSVWKFLKNQISWPLIPPTRVHVTFLYSHVRKLTSKDFILENYKKIKTMINGQLEAIAVPALLFKVRKSSPMLWNFPRKLWDNVIAWKIIKYQSHYFTYTVYEHMFIITWNYCINTL